MGTAFEHYQKGLLGSEAFGHSYAQKTGVFTSKPVEIRAIQFTGDNFVEICDFFGEGSMAGIYGPTERNLDYLILTTAHGDPAPCRKGDWVLPDNQPGTFYPCKNDVFVKRYEPKPAASGTI